MQDNKVDQEYRCPRCKVDGEIYNAPLGKVVRNAASSWRKNIPSSHIYDDCKACNGTGYLPTVVVESIKKSFPNDAESILTELSWAMDHFFFTRWGMYIGVELDGHCHS